MYKIDFKVLTKLMLPIRLRTQSVIDYIYVFVANLKDLNGRFLQFMSEKLDDLSYNCQIPSMQKMLNDRIDPGFRRIRIVDGLYSDTLRLARVSGEKQLVTTFVIHAEATFVMRNFFTVKIPSSISTDDVNRIKKMLNNYKFGGVKYEIVTF